MYRWESLADCSHSRYATRKTPFGGGVARFYETIISFNIDTKHNRRAAKRNAITSWIIILLSNLIK